MHGKRFKPLESALNRFSDISNTWIDILRGWIIACDGFLDDTQYFLNDTTVTVLIKKTTDLLQSYPVSIKDKELCERLSSDFEGLYFYAEAQGEQWNCTRESYMAFKNRFHETPNSLVNDEPYPAATAIYQWLLRQLSINHV